MRSTARILDIAEKHGGDDKRKIIKDLKALRREIKAELMGHINAGIRKAQNEYLQEYKPGQKHFY
jgi:hypothetical protein